jgi:hypothetical protein
MTPRDYAILAQRAYTVLPTIGKSDTAARAVVWPGGIVGFPGTDNLACWLADLDAGCTYVSGMGWLHTGFWRAFQEISGPLLALPDITITLGHSEGAALALFYGAQLCLAGKPPKAIYAFEPPRISTDATLATLFADHGVQLLLTRNGNDVVTDVPRLLEPWQHPGLLTNIGHASQPLPNVVDHMIERVIAAL